MNISAHIYDSSILGFYLFPDGSYTKSCTKCIFNTETQLLTCSCASNKQNRLVYDHSWPRTSIKVNSGKTYSNSNGKLVEDK